MTFFFVCLFACLFCSDTNRPDKSLGTCQWETFFLTSITITIVNGGYVITLFVCLFVCLFVYLSVCLSVQDTLLSRYLIKFLTGFDGNLLDGVK